MKMRNLILTTLVGLSCFDTVEASFVITQKTSKIFTSGIKNCSTYSTNANKLYDFSSCLGLDGARDIISSCTKNIKKNLMDLGCTEEFSNSFTRAYNEDNLQAHKNKLLKIKSEFESFKEKGLTASAQVSKYMNYIENNSLKDLVDVDPEMQKQMSENEAKFRSRKNSCSDVVNLKDPLSVDKPRNQDSVGWCYAFTASDLLSHALGKKVSAVQMAGLFNDKLIGKIIAPSGEGGLVVSTLEAAKKHGVCLENDLPSEDYDYSKISFDLQTLFQTTRKLGANFSEQIVTASHHGKEHGKTLTPKFTNEQVLTSLCQDFKPFLDAYLLLFWRLNADEISELLLKSGSNAFTQMTKSCATQKDDALSSLKIKREIRNSKLYPAIDEQLDKGNILGISYNAGMLEDSSKGGMFANHASSIVGRRFNEETLSCEYLLRNSWGTSCAGYSEDYECKNGHVWIGEEFFKHKNSIFEVEYVENE